MYIQNCNCGRQFLRYFMLLIIFLLCIPRVTYLFIFFFSFILFFMNYTDFWVKSKQLISILAFTVSKIGIFVNWPPIVVDYLNKF